MLPCQVHSLMPSSIFSIVSTVTWHSPKIFNTGQGKSCKADITELDEDMFFKAREESLQVELLDQSHFSGRATNS